MNDKSADVLGALAAGKMPTQRQLDSCLSALLSSDLLKVGNTATGVLSAHGQALVLDAREIVQAVARIGLEKNADDLVQDIIWQYRSMSSVPVQVDANWHNQSKMDINVDAAVNHLDEIPTVDQTELEDDSAALLASLRTLFSLLLTSSGFRLLISDILITTRQILADTASDVAAVAAYVETRAENVEETIRPGEHEGEREITVEDAAKQAQKVDDAVKEDLEKALKEAEMKKHVIGERLAEESPDRVKQTIMERVEALKRDPAYRSSLQTIVTIGEKYARATAQTAHSAAAAAQSAVDDSTVEPSASIDPQFFHHLSQDESSGISDLLRDAKKWLNRALENPGWLTTRTARKELDELYDRTKGILNSKPTWRTDLQRASAEASELSDNLKRDAATQQLLGAIDALGAHTRALGVQSVRNVAWRQLRADLWRDAVGWLLPRILAVLKAVPLPRVELKSESLDAVVDDVTFRAPSFVPDHVRFETLAGAHDWILNSLAQPLLGPAVRAGVRMALSQSVIAGLQALDRKLGEVYAQAKENSSSSRTQANDSEVEPGLWDWWDAFLKGHDKNVHDTDSEDEEEQPEPQTETQVTTKGVIRTTHQPATDTQAESETVLAVGVAEQILPGLGGPENGSHVPEITERARDAIDDVQSAADNATNLVAEVQNDAEAAAGDAKGKAVRAAERMEERRDVERRRRGWKSKAFDL
ncbi:hypothetical protein RSAG8_01586, partial [Rhizoctonia solani AG-8 WAC10335]